MIEIKFRIWVKSYESMVYLLPTMGKYDFEDGFVLSFAVDGYDEFGAHERHDVKKDDVVIMQYTGLKENAFEEDEKNREIYEGDIIEFIDGEKLVVEWNDDTCQWQYSDGSSLNNMSRYGTHKAIIGNLYENPELLTNP